MLSPAYDISFLHYCHATAEGRCAANRRTRRWRTTASRCVFWCIHSHLAGGCASPWTLGQEVAGPLCHTSNPLREAGADDRAPVFTLYHLFSAAARSVSGNARKDSPRIPVRELEYSAARAVIVFGVHPPVDVYFRPNQRPRANSLNCPARVRFFVLREFGFHA